MSREGFGERRSYPRWRARAGVEGRLQVRSRVRLIDLSASGALLTAEAALPVGTQATLRTMFGSDAFSSPLEVCRHAASPLAPATTLGAMFTGMDPASRQSLENFLRQANS